MFAFCCQLTHFWPKSDLAYQSPAYFFEHRYQITVRNNSNAGVSDVPTNLARLPPNGTNLRTFKDYRAKINRKLILKSPRFILPFGANLRTYSTETNEIKR